MEGWERFSLSGTQRPSQFRVRTLSLQPHDGIDYHEADWGEALIVVEHGELEIECATGRCVRFQEGAVLTFAGLTLRRLHNPGDKPLVVNVLSRRAGP
jgi:quercetin dioxygenase-like cupin family protein